MNEAYLDAMKHRRSYRNIGRNTDVTPAKIQEIVEQAVLHTPSAFNSQTTRVVVVLGAQHENLWRLTADTLKKKLSENAFLKTKEKLNDFSAGLGTLLFFEDTDVVEQLQKQFPTYASSFPGWSLQTSGMHQYVIWTALELEGLGASVQHYNPLIDEAVRAEWNLPAGWQLISQMPFGSPIGSPDEKTFLPIEDRVRVMK